MLTKEERAKHWSNGAEDYDWFIKQELDSFKADSWYDLIISQCEKKENLRILDCGCGPGFFSVILSKNGNIVTGIDQAQGMLDKARENADERGVDPEFKIMDLENIDFPDNTFDLILSRNVTWNLSEPDAVYAEWMRLLKKDGVLLVFDSTWYKTLFDEELAAEVKRRVEEYKTKYGEIRDHDSDTRDSHDHVDPKTLPLSNVERPDWDEKKFKDMGLKDVVVNRDISDDVYDDKDRLLYGATPLFMVKGTKKAENVIRVCMAGCCEKAGAGELLENIKEKLGIPHDGAFSDDGKYEAEAAECLWLCKQPPVISVNGKLYTEMDEEKTDRILDSILKKNMKEKDGIDQSGEDEDGHWTTGDRYNRIINNELNSFRKEAWKNRLASQLEGEGLKILDVGTGPGFFACILSEMGHDVTGIDQSEGMLCHAGENAEKLGVSPAFIKMNADDMNFEDDTFDAVVMRNVSWTLPHPNEAYAEFKRILKPGGGLVIYDANWCLHHFDEDKLKKVNKCYDDYIEKYGTDDIISGDHERMVTRHEDKERPLDDVERPAWDKKILENMGMTVSVNEDIGADVYSESEQLAFAEIPLFEVCAVKPEREEKIEKMHTYWQERSKTYIFDPENFKQTQDMVRPFLNDGIKRVIDIGTGPGFMAAAFADMGMEVTATDLCSEMIAKAKENFKSLGLTGEFVVTEADELPFDDDSFDMLVCRNVTWALPDPEKTLKAWKRVLRHGGLLFYLDGNYYNYFFDEEVKKLKDRFEEEYAKDHERVKLPGTPDFNLCDETAKELPLSPLKRPEEWDDHVLPENGFLILKKEIRYPRNLIPFGEIGGYTEQFEIVAKNFKQQ